MGRDNPFLVSDALDVPSSDSASEDAEPEQTIVWRQEALVIGPTPQKYGRVLGLFDASPAHLAPSPKRLKLSSPSKRRKSEDGELVESVASPLKMRSTPQKTPSFLKRQASTLTLDETDVSSTSRLLFQPKCVSSLSAIIKQNRIWYDADTQDDDALEALREAEGESMPLGAQDADSNENDDEPAAQDTGKVRWKKKGLKRSHRRVVMRPQAPRTIAPALPSSDMALGAETESDEEIGDEEVAAKQHQPTMDEEVPAWLEKENLEIRDKAEARKLQQQASKPGKKARASDANYKSLKLRNSGAKGGSRFGRGRFGGRR